MISVENNLREKDLWVGTEKGRGMKEVVWFSKERFEPPNVLVGLYQGWAWAGLRLVLEAPCKSLGIGNISEKHTFSSGKGYPKLFQFQVLR